MSNDEQAGERRTTSPGTTWRASSTTPPAEPTKKQARLLSRPSVAGLIGEGVFYALLLALALLGG